MIKSKIKHNQKYSLESFLNGFDRYLIPSFQRKYSWGKKHVAELWNSILTNEPNYYIGTIVGIQSIDSKTGGQVIEIIDGQQRITTLSLFCLALRNFISEESNKNISDTEGKIEHFERFLSHTNKLRDSHVKNIRLRFTKPILNNVYEGLINSTQDGYESYVCDAASKEHGFVQGYPDGKFRPDGPVSRTEALKMIFEVMELPAPSISESDRDVIKFVDISVAAWYTKYLYAAFAEGMLPIPGQTGSHFYPDRGLTRGEMAAYQNRISPQDSNL
jgi:hypothetical protein